ncbi:hypothetical protein [Psychroserpens sp. SPM9]|uniref:hypothetical protein n=1 Tax=Psychroserpens sp. SPM9 TaxID=2975598 RepID=UPI0021A3454B|nr:hypothetical protein [Psychroserpens sp. SPM9]MDG5492272.1 hypothetical protein [Psychroserpens sp. SPM9]
MKKLIFFIALLMCTTVFAQDRIIKPKPTLTIVDVKNFDFNSNFLNVYYQIDDYEIIPLKILFFKQKHTTEVINEATSKTVPVSTIMIKGEYSKNGTKSVYFKYSYTDMDAFLAIKSLFENYDQEGKLILIKSPAKIGDPTTINVPGSESKQSIFPIQNDQIEYIHKASTKMF